MSNPADTGIYAALKQLARDEGEANARVVAENWQTLLEGMSEIANGTEVFGIGLLLAPVMRFTNREPPEDLDVPFCKDEKESE